jgi:thiosulfate dehydrogenase
MSSCVGWFGVGVLLTVVVLVLGGYILVKSGAISMETTARPLPLEKIVARMALRASIGSAANQKNKLAFDNANMLAGAKIFKQNCAVCHGIPGEPRSAISKGMFPEPPQLFEDREMVVDDAEGVTYWKVTHGIRLSGMPGFEGTLSETERRQVTMLVAHANNLAPPVRAELSH